MENQLNLIKNAETEFSFLPFKLVLPLLKNMASMLKGNKQEYEKLIILSEWYYNNEQIAKSIITLREWFISFIGNKANYDVSIHGNRSELIQKVFYRDGLLKKYKLHSITKLFNFINNIRRKVGHVDVSESYYKGKATDKLKIKKYIDSAILMFDSIGENPQFQKCISEIKNSSWFKPISTSQKKKKYKSNKR